MHSLLLWRDQQKVQGQGLGQGQRHLQKPLLGHLWMPEAADSPLTLLGQAPVPPLLSRLSAGRCKGTVWSDEFIMQLQEHDWLSGLWLA